MPALYNLAGAGLLDDEFSVLGVDRDDGRDQDFQDRQKTAMESFTPAAGGEFAEKSLNADWWGWLATRLHYVQGDFTQASIFDDLRRLLKDGNAIFYLAVADRFFGTIIDRLDEAGLTAQENGCFRRVVIEKPFGHDLSSAKELNASILLKLNEDQIYRIDHFLGKETVQNIMAIRFANRIFEPLWSREHVDSVQITAAETVGVEGRGKFYETTGALRDMVPNHMFQLLALTAMESPGSWNANEVRGGKAELVNAIHRLTATDIVRGQYAAGCVKAEGVSGYTGERDVAPNSRVETYVAVKLTIDNPRWTGVPFYLRTGKRMSARTTQIAIQFKQEPFGLFRDMPMDRLMPNVLVLHLQPDEGVAIGFSAKRPGQLVDLASVQLGFSYKEFFDLKPATGYETLIYDVMIGDPMLFNRADNIEAGWSAVQTVLDAVANGQVDVHAYPAGSDGPAEADALLSVDGRAWMDLA